MLNKGRSWHITLDRGASAYFSPNRVKTAGCAKTITSAVAGTTRSAAYFTENWKTFPSVSFSFCALSLEKAGKSTVVIGVRVFLQIFYDFDEMKSCCCIEHVHEEENC